MTLDEELERVVPLVESLAREGVPLSVDTSKPEVMRAAIDAGAAIINDVHALQSPGAVDAVAGSDCGVVLMHMQGVPRTMQMAPRYEDVVAEVRVFLRERLGALEAAGVSPDRVALDPGFGFGKTVEHNFTLLRELQRFTSLGCPVVAGLSRKSMLGAVTGRAVGERAVRRRWWARCSRPSAARGCCACTTWPPRATACASGRPCKARERHGESQIFRDGRSAWNGRRSADHAGVRAAARPGGRTRADEHGRGTIGRRC